MFEPIERAVGVVVLEERDQPGRDADHLLGRDVHILDLIDGNRDEVGLVARSQGRPLELAMVVHDRVGRRQVGLALLVGPHPDDFLALLAVVDLAVRRDEESVLIDSAVNAQRADQADVGAFRRLDRADPSVVRDVDVADLEAGSLAVQAARPQGRESPLVRELGQGIGLVHDLRQFAAAEEVLDRRADALGVDQRPGRHVVCFLQAHPLLHGAAELEKPLAQLVGRQLVDGPQPPVPQVVDVVDVDPGVIAAAQPQNVPDGVDVILGIERHLVVRHILIELAIDPEPADLAQPVAVGVEEFLVEELAGFLELGRIARPEPLVDSQQCALVIARGVILERLEDQLIAGVLEHGDGTEIACVGQHLGQSLRDCRATLDQNLAGGRIDDVAAGDPALQLRRRLGIRRVDRFGLMESIEDQVVGRVLRAHGAKQSHGRELTGLIDPDPQGFLLRDLQLDPASALGDDAAGVQLLVARLDLDHEIDARRSVELADDHALGAVDDELAAPDHDRHVAQVDRFFEHGLALVQTQPDMEWAAEGQAELAAFVGIVPGLAQVIAKVFQLQGLVVTLDRENFPENAFEPRVGTLFGEIVGLEESLIAPGLDLGQVGNRKLVVNPAEIPFQGRDDAPHGGRSGHVVALLKGSRGHQIKVEVNDRAPV